MIHKNHNVDINWDNESFDYNSYSSTNLRQKIAHGHGMISKCKRMRWYPSRKLAFVYSVSADPRYIERFVDYIPW